MVTSLSGRCRTGKRFSKRGATAENASHFADAIRVVLSRDVAAAAICLNRRHRLRDIRKSSNEQRRHTEFAWA
jgi:hypothetical protein